MDTVIMSDGTPVTLDMSPSAVRGEPGVFDSLYKQAIQAREAAQAASASAPDSATPAQIDSLTMPFLRTRPVQANPPAGVLRQQSLAALDEVQNTRPRTPELDISI